MPYTRQQGDFNLTDELDGRRPTPDRAVYVETIPGKDALESSNELRERFRRPQGQRSTHRKLISLQTDDFLALVT